MLRPERRKRPIEQQQSTEPTDRDELPLPPDELDELCDLLVSGETFDAESQTAATDEVWDTIGSEPNTTTLLDRPAVKRTIGRVRPKQAPIARKKPKVQPPIEPPNDAPPRRSRWRWIAALVCMLAAGFFGLRASGMIGTTAPSHEASSPIKYGRPWLQPIENVRPCDRVLGRNPLLTAEDRAKFGPEPDPATWKLLSLRAPKVDGSWAEVEIVQPPEWLEEHQPQVGGTVDIWVPECGIEGRAEVLSIGPCPPVKPGIGPVVLATFKHQAAATIHVYFEGTDKPIGVTANHPWFSQDRQDFVRTDNLRIGELLDALKKKSRVARLVPQPRPKPVHNLMVQGEHVYRVGEDGVLVHNGNTCVDIAFGRQRNLRYGIRASVEAFGNRFGAAHMRNWVERGLMTVAESQGRRGSWPKIFKRMVDETLAKGGRIRFNLDDVNVRNALASGAHYSEDFTEWELRQILGNKEWLKSAVFYLKGKRLNASELRSLGIR